MDRSEFADQLLQTNIPSNMPIEDQQKALDSLVKTAHSLLPCYNVIREKKKFKNVLLIYKCIYKVY